MEAQRFPDDFDGIVAGAPVLDFVGIAAQLVKNMQAVFPDPRNVSTPVFTPKTLKSIEAQIVEKCDALDRVTDGLLEEPRRCHPVQSHVGPAGAVFRSEPGRAMPRSAGFRGEPGRAVSPRWPSQRVPVGRVISRSAGPYVRLLNIALF